MPARQACGAALPTHQGLHLPRSAPPSLVRAEAHAFEAPTRDRNRKCPAHTCRNAASQFLAVFFFFTSDWNKAEEDPLETAMPGSQARRLVGEWRPEREQHANLSATMRNCA